MKKKTFPKWQIVDLDCIRGSTEDHITIKNYKWLSRFGAKLHAVPEIAAWEFRPAYFVIGYQPSRPCTMGKVIKIPIPFMKKDHGIILRLLKEEYHVKDKNSAKSTQNTWTNTGRSKKLQ